MTHKAKVFDSARVVLQQGISLVEASAGTGKTYAIAMLVLRAVAELAIPIEQILVVTYTKAAAEELKSRIRARLVEAHAVLQGTSAAGDQTMAAWIEGIGERQRVLDLLQLALYDIDRAGIYTIHSFCQRMLQEQAMESGQLFDVELLADIDRVQQEVTEDYWRRRLYRLPVLPCALLMAQYGHPRALYDSVRGAAGTLARLEPETTEPAEAAVVLEQAVERLRFWWRDHGEELRRHFFAARDEGKLKKRLQENLEDWWRQLDDFFLHGSASLPQDLLLLSRDGLLAEVNGRAIRGREKQLAYLHDWPLPDEEAATLEQATHQLVLSFRLGLAHTLRAEVSERLRRQRTMSFDDLIHGLRKALQAQGGDNLRRILAERFKMALIDEFQDTDSSQWQIFSTLFGDDSHYLFLIGDPKQAIYKFRGADIYSYFTAKESADRQLTLEKNYRSCPDLVKEVNRLFTSRTNPFGFGESLLAYHEVQPAKTPEDGALLQSATPLAPMVYWQLPANTVDSKGQWYAGEAADLLRIHTLKEICRLLDSVDPVTCSRNTGELKRQRPVQPKDIAILVRSNRQAEGYRQALNDIGVPAVVNSKQSVFETRECRELFRLFQALAAPGDMTCLKSAMTISWFGLTGNELVAIWQDESAFDGWSGRFFDYHQLWQSHGVLTMMNRLLEQENVHTRLAGQQMAERRIANIHHLLELVQQVENGENLGISQMLQWLRSMMQDGRGMDDVELRLESDVEAVHIVTMHGAKGLEYPIVFCPYLWYRSNRLRNEKALIACHDRDKELVIDLGSAQFAARKAQALEEELAEDLRLLYVALTRAELRCYVMWADVKGGGKLFGSRESALGYLLFPDKTTESGESLVLQQAQTNPVVDTILLPVQVDGEVHYRPVEQRTDTLSPRSPSSRSLQTDRLMTSYSSLAALSEQEKEYVFAGDHEADAAQTPLHLTGLPAGARFGNVVHDCLEVVSFRDIASGSMQDEQLITTCSRYGVEADTGSLRQLLHNVVGTPLWQSDNRTLKGEPFRLADLSAERLVKEMGFYFHLDRFTTDKINTILADEPTVTPLSQRTMHGYLTGFVDLFCAYRGKYYIIDYKTNHLGDTLEAYSGDQLIQAMQEHNYGLQYWIYTLVAHRHLQNAVPGYSYATHFGGVMYLFVRGMTPELPGSGVFSAMPDEPLLDRLAICLGGR